MVQRRRGLIYLSLTVPIGLGLYLAGLHLFCWSNYNLAQSDLEKGDYENAEIHLQRCLQGWSESGQTHFDLARTYRILGKHDLANEELDECRRLSWSPAAIELEDTLVRAQQGELLRLLPLLLKWADLDSPDTAPVQQVLADQFFARNYLAEAKKWGERFLTHYPKNVRVIKQVAQIYSINYEGAAALKYYRRALDILPEDDGTREALAETLLAFNEPKAALDYYRELETRHPRSKTVLLGLGRCYRSLGILDKGRPILDSLATRFPRSWEVLSERGKLAEQEHQFSEAVNWLRRAVALYPFDARTLHSLHLSLTHDKKADPQEIERVRAKHEEIKQLEARVDFLVRRELSRTPGKAELYYELAVIYHRIGPEKRGHYYYLDQALGLIAAKGKEIPAQEKALNATIQAEIARLPKEPAAYYVGALAYQRTQHQSEALAYFKKTLQLDPAHAGARRALAEYGTQMGNPEPAAQPAAPTGGK